MLLLEYYKFSPSYYGGWTDELQSNLLNIKPHARISTFLIGIVIGYLYMKHVNDMKTKLKTMEIVLNSDSVSFVKEGKADHFENFAFGWQTANQFGYSIILQDLL